MEVNGPGSIQGSHPLQQIRPQNEVDQLAESKPADIRDEVEISPAGALSGEVDGISDVRAERLAQIKAAIDNGTYETEEKLQVAVDRLFDELQAEDGDLSP